MEEVGTAALTAYDSETLFRAMGPSTAAIPLWMFWRGWTGMSGQENIKCQKHRQMLCLQRYTGSG